MLGSRCGSCGVMEGVGGEFSWGESKIMLGNVVFFCRFIGGCYGFCIRVNTFHFIDVWLFAFCIRFSVWQFCDVGGSGGGRS